VKKRQWIVFWIAVFLAGLSGQLTVFGLDAQYSYVSTSTLSISGLAHDSWTGNGTVTFSGDGTFDLFDGTYDYTGTYTVVKKGKQMTFALDDNGLSAVESDLMDNIQNMADNAGVSLSDLSLTIQSDTVSKAAVKNGMPTKTTLTVRGKVSAYVDGKFKTKSFTYKSVVVPYTS
jgi:hypothetical protein